MFYIDCGDKQNMPDKTSGVINYSVVTYNRNDFINFEDIFENESLNRPEWVRQNTATGEVIVYDSGNNCLYFFTSDGEYIRKSGRTGQGPGEFFRVYFIHIDNDGDIYVYEDGNRRVQIFSKTGRFIDSFRIKGMINRESRMTITKNKEVVMNDPLKGYYFSIYSRDGTLKKHIGEIQKIRKSDSEFNDEYNKSYGIGIPFEDENGNLVLFLQNLAIVKVFNDSGTVINDISLEKVLQVKTYKDEKFGKFEIPMPTYYDDIIYKNGIYYLLMRYRVTIEDDKVNVIMYALNKDFEVIKKGYLPIKEDMWYIGSIAVLESSQNLLISSTMDAEVCRYFLNDLIK